MTLYTGLFLVLVALGFMGVRDIRTNAGPILLLLVVAFGSLGAVMMVKSMTDTYNCKIGYGPCEPGYSPINKIVHTEPS